LAGDNLYLAALALQFLDEHLGDDGFPSLAALLDAGCGAFDARRDLVLPKLDCGAPRTDAEDGGYVGAADEFGAVLHYDRNRHYFDCLGARHALTISPLSKTAVSLIFNYVEVVYVPFTPCASR
jgi:hypothetical protein